LLNGLLWSIFKNILSRCFLLWIHGELDQG
jgi:hypothetical protein